MKNDVVRWSLAANAQNEQNVSTKSVKYNKSYDASGYNIRRFVFTNNNNHKNNNNQDNDWTEKSERTQDDDQEELLKQLECNEDQQEQQLYCDTKENLLNSRATTNSFLLNFNYNSQLSQQNAIEKNSKLKSNKFTNKSRRHFKQKQLQQQQQYNHYCQHYPQQSRRTFIISHLNRILLNYVQLSVILVFLLCMALNVDFVIVPSANAAIATTIANKTKTPTTTSFNAINGYVGGANLALLSVPYELKNATESGESGSDDDEAKVEHYTHTWAVHIPNGENNGLAAEVAKDHGFVNLGKIFNDHYHFAHHTVSKRSLTPSQTHQLRLDSDHRVHWAKQQQIKSRRKRDYIRMRPSRTSSRALSQVDIVPLNDPKWAQMWYLNRGGGLDMNVVPAWQAGITGKGIVVTILDDGLESDHPDIEHNYDPDASYDVNSHDNDPMPHYDMTDSNRHGTRCAGEVAATANNSICAVGIAFGASVGGVRMLDGDVTDAVEARSLSLNPQHIDIYSASWGPDDDGKTVDGPGELAQRAFIEGVTKGRQGKGSIFIWASGNGGRELDNCNCDGYTNSIWTLSISSATEEGHVPWYSEKCSSTLATTYSSGGQSEKQVVTTDLHHSCTVSHTGTSASAPLAAGIAALVLESNTNLTWRDLQHIVVRTAKPANLRDPTWSKNGVGRRISHSFGYGLMDAAAMVKVARHWKTVPEQQRCEINAPHVDKVIPPRSYITLQLTVKHCLSVNYLEHVQAKITLTSQRRGDIQLNLKSPAGTRVTLLTSRVHDVSRSGFNQWPFMSVHTWGESPHGNWQLEIHNEGRYMAQITQWNLIFYGTKIPAQPEDAEHISDGLFGNDMAHNDIEYDNSLQWRNMQQVGESNPVENDKTNTSCLKATPDQRCLECASPTYFYNGRCYEQCPTNTYSLINDEHRDDETATGNAAANINDNKISKANINDNDNDDYDELQSIDRRRRRRLRRKLLSALPYADTNEFHRCEKCDISCQRCYGPHNSQCSTCPPGSQLRKLPQTNETFCYSFTERSSGNSHGDGIYNAIVQTINNAKHSGGVDGEGKGASSATRMYSTSKKHLSLIIVPAILLIGVIVLFSFTRSTNMRITSFWRRDGGGGGSSVPLSNVSYDRVALLTDCEDDDVDDDTISEQVEENKVQDGGIAKYSYNDDDNDDADHIYKDNDAYIDDATSSRKELTPSIIEAVVNINDSSEEEELFDLLQRGESKR